MVLAFTAARSKINVKAIKYPIISDGLPRVVTDHLIYCIYSTSLTVIKVNNDKFFMSFFVNIRSTRNSRPEVFCKKGVLKNFTKFTGNHRRIVWVCLTILWRLSTLSKKRLCLRYFSANFEISHNTFFYKYLRYLLLVHNEQLTLAKHFY